jgi:hypothetical protein
MEVYCVRAIFDEVIIWDIDVLLSDVLTPTYHLVSIIIHMNKNRTGYQIHDWEFVFYAERQVF